MRRSASDYLDELVHLPGPSLLGLGQGIDVEFGDRVAGGREHRDLVVGQLGHPLQAGERGLDVPGRLLVLASLPLAPGPPAWLLPDRRR